MREPPAATRVDRFTAALALKWPLAGRWFPKLFRYGLAVVGPVGSAGAQFLLSLQLLHALSPQAFGGFSFLLVASQFTASLWSALFCAPLPVLLNQGAATERAMLERCLMTSCLALAAVFAVVFFGMAMAMAVPLFASLMFGVYGAAFLIRWFARAYAYVTGRPLRTTASDTVYTLGLLIGVALMAITRSVTLQMAYAVLMASAVLGLLPFGVDYLRKQFIVVRFKDLPRYRMIWSAHSSWSTIGVLTTEVTVNAHAYIVTALRGASAFAPLAASALLMRPISVIANALSELERPQIARQLAAGRRDEALGSVNSFRLVVMTVWGLTVIGAWALWRYAPNVLSLAQYDRRVLTVGLALWLAIAGVRMWRSPDSILLQAAGQFRPLAQASIISCGVSLAGVTIGLLAGGPLYSLPGLLVGELVFAVWTWRQKRAWLAI